MRNKKGFTLLELLIAATIVGLLAMYATVSYRNSMFEARLAEAKARTETVGVARQRFELDYPGISFSGFVSNLPKEDCLVGAGSSDAVAQDLIHCGYLETGNWENEYFTIYPCGKTTETTCSSLITDALACMQIKSDTKTQKKIPERYRGNYLYCVGEFSGAKERLSTGS